MAGTCDSVNHLLSPYLDDELSGAERKVVDTHLQGCPTCSGRLVDLRATSAAMQAYLTQRAEGVDFAGFSQRVMAQVKKEPLPLGQRLRVAWTELLAYHSTAIYSAFGASAVAALAVGMVFTRGVSVTGNPIDNALVVHSLSVSDPRYEPVVMHTDDGETVIMLVEHSTDATDDGTDPKKAEAIDGKSSKATDDATKVPTKPAEVPRGGEL